MYIYKSVGTHANKPEQTEHPCGYSVLNNFLI